MASVRSIRNDLFIQTCACAQKVWMFMIVRRTFMSALFGVGTDGCAGVSV